MKSVENFRAVYAWTSLLTFMKTFALHLRPPSCLGHCCLHHRFSCCHAGPLRCMSAAFVICIRPFGTLVIRVHRCKTGAAGGAQQDAVGVCAQELQDPQLALFLCHMLEGPMGPLQHHLITSQLLPRKTTPSC